MKHFIISETEAVGHPELEAIVTVVKAAKSLVKSH